MVVKARFSFNEMVQIASSCDHSYDGIFFYAVKTTGIFCRPSCRSKTPNKENITFFETSEDAKRAGFRPCKRCQPDTEYFDPKLELVNDTKAYIHRHYNDNLTLKKIARHIGISQYYLSRLFKTHTSKTIHSYLEHVRINNAVHFLTTTELSIIDICFEVGFQNSSSFYHAFRKETQHTPQQYRWGLSHDL